jgi:hypothetical protein
LGAHYTRLGGTEDHYSKHMSSWSYCKIKFILWDSDATSGLIAGRFYSWLFIAYHAEYIFWQLKLKKRDLVIPEILTRRVLSCWCLFFRCSNRELRRRGNLNWYHMPHTAVSFRLMHPRKNIMFLHEIVWYVTIISSMIVIE